VAAHRVAEDRRAREVERERGRREERRQLRGDELVPATRRVGGRGSVSCSQLLGVLCLVPRSDVRRAGLQGCAVPPQSTTAPREARARRVLRTRAARLGRARARRTCCSASSTAPCSPSGRSRRPCLRVGGARVSSGRCFLGESSASRDVPKSQSLSSPSTSAPRGDVSGKTRAMPARERRVSSRGKRRKGMSGDAPSSAASRRKPPFHGLRERVLVSVGESVAKHRGREGRTPCPRCR